METPAELASRSPNPAVRYGQNPAAQLRPSYGERAPREQQRLRALPPLAKLYFFT